MSLYHDVVALDEALTRADQAERKAQEPGATQKDKDDAVRYREIAEMYQARMRERGGIYIDNSLTIPNGRRE